MEAGLIVEIDGESHYAGQEARECGRVREQYLTALGFRVVRFTNDEVMANRDGVLQQILAAIARQPPPQPSPWQGREQYLPELGATASSDW